MCIAENLRQQIEKYKRGTGEDAMLVVIENRDETMGVHFVAFEPHIGLTVDGKPPHPRWYQEAEAFHPLQWAPTSHH